MFTDAVCIVTGGESGIGAACAARLGASGARVAITYYRDAAAAEKVCLAIGGLDQAIALQTDVADEAAVDQLFETVEQAFGPATLLVNSAGLNMSGTNLVDMELAQFDRVIRSLWPVPDLPPFRARARRSRPDRTDRQHLINPRARTAPGRRRLRFGERRSFAIDRDACA
jgi:hypothetical protein